MKNIFKKIILVILGFAFLYWIYKTYNWEIDFSKLDLNYWLLLIGPFFYLLSHVLKAYRLMRLASDKVTENFFSIISFQIETNAWNLILPFKLGEGIRIFRFSKISKIKTLDVTMIIVLEKIIDIIVLFLFFIVGILISEVSVSDVGIVFYVLSIFLLFLVSVSLIFENFLSSFQIALIQRNKSWLSLKLLNITSILLRSMLKLKSLVNGKHIELFFISFLIWSLELISFFAVFSFFQLQMEGVFFITVFVALSWILPNASLGIGGIQLAFYSVALLLNIEERLEYSFVYILVVYIPSIILGLYLLIKRKIK
jgi:hypothetical protein